MSYFPLLLKRELVPIPPFTAWTKRTWLHTDESQKISRSESLLRIFRSCPPPPMYQYHKMALTRCRANLSPDGKTFAHRLA